MKRSYKNNQFKISAPTWNEEFELLDRSYSVSDIQDYFEYILKKQGENTDNQPVRIYVNKTENRIMLKKRQNIVCENFLHLEISEVVLVHCNIVNNDHQQDSRVLYTFIPNKLLGQLLDISPKNFVFLKPFASELSYIEVWFTDQNSKPQEIEGKINIPLVIS